MRRISSRLHTNHLFIPSSNRFLPVPKLTGFELLFYTVIAAHSRAIIAIRDTNLTAQQQTMAQKYLVPLPKLLPFAPYYAEFAQKRTAAFAEFAALFAIAVIFRNVMPA